MTSTKIDPSKARAVLAQIDRDEVIDFHRRLVRIPSINPPGDVREAIQVCADVLAGAGFENSYITEDDTMPNLVSRLRRGSGPTLLFNAHVDVVPTGEDSAWSYPPFAAEIVDGRIYGRGAGDDKASVTAQIMGAIALARSGVPLQGTLIVNEVADEEAGGAKGAIIVADSPEIKPDFVIAGEQTMNRVCVGEKGSAGAIVTVYGRAAHGALPWEGANAIEGMARIITALQSELWPKLAHRTHQYFKPSSAAVTMIDGGVMRNVIPDRCSMTIDRRIVPGEDPAACLAEVQEIAERAIRDVAGLRLEVRPSGLSGRRAIMTPPESQIVQAMVAANRHLGFSTELTGFSMATDGRHFAAKGYPTIIYGPGDPSLAHQPDEWVGIDEVLDATKAYALAPLALLTP